MNLLRLLSGHSNLQTIARCLTLIFVTSVFLSVPFTLFQYLDLQYRMEHNDQLQYITNQITDSEQRVTMTEYGYRTTPWNIPMRVSTAAYLALPGIVTFIASFACLSFLQGTRKRRYATALAVAATIIPVSLLTNLPWDLIYWNGWEWYASVGLVVFYGVFLVIIAGIINAFSLCTNNTSKK